MYNHLSKPTLVALSWLRAVGLLTQVVFLFWLKMSPTLLLVVILGLQVLLLMSSMGYLNKQIGAVRLYILIVFDSILLMAYIYQTGGVANPLISLILLQVAISSVLCSNKQSISILLISISFYSYLLWSQPHHAHMTEYSSHLTGMWAVFLICAGLLYFIIRKLISETQLQQARLDDFKRKQQRDEHIMALGLTAADIAHQLNTPLSTLAVVCEDLKDELLDNQTIDSSLQGDLQLLVKQVGDCQRINQQMANRVQQLRSGNRESQVAIDFFRGVVRSFLLLRPETQVKHNFDELGSSPNVETDSGVTCALLNLLDNAAKASDRNNNNSIELELTFNEQSCQLRIIDFGIGLNSELIKGFGLQPNFDSEQGLGIGSLLTSANLEKVGGSLEVTSDQTGCQVTVSLPLQLRPKLVIKNHLEENQRQSEVNR